MTQPDTPAPCDDLVERLRKPTNADSIYDWVIDARKRSKSDLSRLGFQNEMDLIDEQRAEAAAEIERLQGALARRPEPAADAVEAVKAAVLEQLQVTPMVAAPPDVLLRLQAEQIARAAIAAMPGLRTTTDTDAAR